MSEDDVVRLRADMFILEERAFLRQEDSASVSVQKDSLLTSRGISRAAYEEAIATYKSDLDGWRSFSAKVVARLEAIQRERAKQSDTLKNAAKPSK